MPIIVKSNKETETDFIKKEPTEKEQRIVNSINEKFITYRQQYIWQKSDGTYINSNAVHKKLTDTEVLNHIRRTDTIGIFSGEKSAKFMLLDIDLADRSDKERQFTVKRVKNCLNEIGISEQFIHVVYSGNKGYHVILFFDDIIALTYIRSLYEYILYQTGHNNSEIELRPQSRIGVKLPLSIHRKTGNICSFVDSDFIPIQDEFYLEKAMQIERWYFVEVIQNMEKEFSKQKKIEFAKRKLNKDYKVPECFKMYKDSKYTFNKANEIEENGIQQPSSRHNCLMLLGMKYNTEGYKKEDIREKLIEWMERQDTNLYNTSWNNCVKDIDRIVKWIEEENACIVDNSIDIQIYDKEIEKVLELPRYTQQIMMYAMLAHSKRYATPNGVFYMTYEQIKDCTGIVEDGTVLRLLKYFENNNFIEVISRGQSLTPNRYRVLIRIDENIKQSKQSKIESKIVVSIIPKNTYMTDIEKNYKDTVLKMYNKVKLKKMVSRRCYNNLVS